LDDHLEQELKNTVSLDEIQKMYPKIIHNKSQNLLIYLGLIAEINGHHVYSLLCYSSAIQLRNNSFLQISIARSQANLGQWKNSLETILSIDIVDFSQLIQNYDPVILYGFLPYNLQLQVFKQFNNNEHDLGEDIKNLESLLAIREEKHIFNVLKNSIDYDTSIYTNFSKLFLGKLSLEMMDELKKIDTDNKILPRLTQKAPKTVESDILYSAKKLKTNHIYNELDNIDGWLSPLEGRVLALLAQRTKKNGVIVEIGSWKGKSSSFLGLGSKNGGRAKVYCIDPHNWSDNAMTATTYNSWNETIHKMGLDDIVTNIREKSERAADAFSDRVGLLFIDGDHSKEALIKDIESWFPKLENGAYVAFHDAYFSDVFYVLQRRIFESEDFRIVDFVEGLLIVQYLPNSCEERNYQELAIWLYFIYKSQLFERFERKTKSELYNLAENYKKTRG